MKRILFVLALSFVSLCASAQTKTAYCDVYARGGGKHMKITIMYNDNPYELHHNGSRTSLGDVLNKLATNGWVLDGEIVIPRHPLFALFTRHKLHLIMKKEYQEGEDPFKIFENNVHVDNKQPINNDSNLIDTNTGYVEINEPIEQPAKEYQVEDKPIVSISIRENNGSWDDAQQYCDNLGEGWMLPSKEQIDYIVDNLDIKFNNCWTNIEISEKKAKVYHRGYTSPCTTFLKSKNDVGILAVKVINNAD